MSSREDNAKLNFSFAGCGFMGIYHFGVAACLKRHVPHLLDKISGCSAGALAVAFAIAEIPLSVGVSMWLDTTLTTRNKVIGPFSPSSDVAGMVRTFMESCAPPDVHHRVNGRVHVSLTRVRDMTNVVLSHFDSRAEFIDALICSISIPGFVGLVPPTFRGERYMDGGFSKNLIVLDEHTVTVNPFSGESDICPRDSPTMSPWLLSLPNNTSFEISAKNIARVRYMMLSPGPEVLGEICQQGFTDTLNFLENRGLLACHGCRLGSPGSSSDSSEAGEDEEANCQECEAIRENPEDSALPESFRILFQEATRAENSAFGALLRQYRISPLISVATLPLTLSWDLFYAVALKVSKIPKFIHPRLSISISKSISPSFATFDKGTLWGNFLKLPQFRE